MIIGSTGPGSSCTEGDVQLVEGGLSLWGEWRYALMGGGEPSVVMLHPGGQMVP